MEEIGLIGVGEAGKMFIDSLYSKNYSVTCFKKGHELEYAKTQGATVVDTPAEVAEVADTILIAVPGSSEVEATMEGSNGLLESVNEGQTIIDTTTVKISTANKYKAKCENQGIEWISAPWTSAAPIEGLLMIVGGDETGYNNSKNIIKTISKDHVYINTVEEAMLLKYLLQIRYAAQMAVDAEVVEIAKTTNLDPSYLNSFFGMDISDNLFNEHYEPTQDGMGSLEMWDKDLAYAIEFGNGDVPNRKGIAMPLTLAVHEAYKYSNNTTNSKEKHASAVAKYWQILNGSSIGDC